MSFSFLDPRLPARFWSKVIPEPNSGCWLWFASLSVCGYGRYKAHGVNRLVHRVTYAAMVGAIPVGLQLDHLCRTRCCANPDHVEPVTPGENVRRGLAGAVAGARQRVKTNCPQQGSPRRKFNRHRPGDLTMNESESTTLEEWRSRALRAEAIVALVTPTAEERDAWARDVSGHDLTGPAHAHIERVLAATGAATKVG